MDKPTETYWKIRLEKLKKALEANNFEVYLSDSAADAKTLVLDTILPAVKPASVAWGGSMTVVSSGLYPALKDHPDVEVLDRFFGFFHQGLHVIFSRFRGDYAIENNDTDTSVCFNSII